MGVLGRLGGGCTFESVAYVTGRRPLATSEFKLLFDRHGGCGRGGAGPIVTELTIVPYTVTIQPEFMVARVAAGFVQLDITGLPAPSLPPSPSRPAVSEESSVPWRSGGQP